MKIKIINELSAKLEVGGKVFEGVFAPLSGASSQDLKGGFDFGKDSWKTIPNQIKGMKLLENGNVLIKFEYFGRDSDKRVDLILEPNKPLTIKDKLGRWNKDKWEMEYEDIKYEFNLRYEEIEIDENNLMLSIIETADDSSGEVYINGKEEREVPVRVGEKLSAKLIKGEKEKFEIEEVNGVNIKIKCLDFMRKDVWPHDQAHYIEINQFCFMYYSQDGGSHTRYDYESWHWRMEIRLKIKNAIMFKGERK